MSDKKEETNNKQGMSDKKGTPSEEYVIDKFNRLIGNTQTKSTDDSQKGNTQADTKEDKDKKTEAHTSSSSGYIIMVIVIVIIIIIIIFVYYKYYKGESILPKTKGLTS